MIKNILIINSSQETNQLPTDLFKELKQKGYIFYLLSSSANPYNQFKQKNWPAKKIYLGPNLNNGFNSLLFIILLPILLLSHLAYLAYFKSSVKITAIFCLNWNEKIIITPIAKILGLKIIWLEPLSIDHKTKNKLLRRLYKFNSKWAAVIAFTGLTKIQLKKIGLDKNNIKTINMGIQLNRYERQDNIFNKLAQADRGDFHHKYFTVGTDANLSYQQNIETLFRAVKICLTIIPNFQLIIIGDGIEKNNLSWLAKKMGINNLVWFIGGHASPSQGRQIYLQKWLDSFDIFVVTSETPDLTDFNICLRAMATGLPIIGPGNLGLEDIIIGNQTGFLINAGDNEMLAQQIIKLQQNKNLRLKLGKNAKERVNKYFRINNMVRQFEKIINRPVT